MPVGKFKDFNTCVMMMKRDGHDDDSAKKICGEMEKRMKQKFSFNTIIKESLHDDDKEFFIEGVAINATETRNGITYTGEELGRSAESLMGKPLLKDHDNSVMSIVGRVTAAEFVDSRIVFKAKVMDETMRGMIRDGRVQNVSIGARVESIDEEKVGEKTQRIAKGLEFLELSLVAVPGDPGASICQALEEAFNMKINEEKAMCAACGATMECPECGKKMAKHEEEKMEDEGLKQVLESVAKLSEAVAKQGEAITELKKVKEEAEEPKEEPKGEVSQPEPAEAEEIGFVKVTEDDSHERIFSAKTDKRGRYITN